MECIELQSKIWSCLLTKLFKPSIAKEKYPTPHNHILFMSPLLAAHAFENNCFQGWNTRRVKFHQQSLKNASRVHREWQPLPLVSQKQLHLSLVFWFCYSFFFFKLKNIKISFVTYMHQLYYIFSKGCSESNASFFIMLAHDVRSGYWWYGSRDWTFPSISCYSLLPCDRWQQRGSLTNGIWHGSMDEAEVCRRIPPCGNSGIHWHSSILLNVYGDQRVDVSTVFRQWWQWVTSAGADYDEYSMQAFVHF